MAGCGAILARSHKIGARDACSRPWGQGEDGTSRQQWPVNRGSSERLTSDLEFAGAGEQAEGAGRLSLSRATRHKREFEGAPRPSLA